MPRKQTGKQRVERKAVQNVNTPEFYDLYERRQGRWIWVCTLKRHEIPQKEGVRIITANAGMAR